MIGAINAKKKARSWFDSLSRQDLDAFLAGWAEDATFVYYTGSSISGEIEGKEAIRKWFQGLMEQFPLTSFTAKNIFVENLFTLGSTNTIAIVWDVKWQYKGGQEGVSSGITIVHVKKGKVVLMREYIPKPVESWHSHVQRCISQSPVG